jgi:N-formylglutamate amidohydrolase
LHGPSGKASSVIEPSSQVASFETVAAGPIVAVALHAAHRVRGEVAAWFALDDDARLREEDPYTDTWTRVADTRVVALRSRFELDLNRSRERAVYADPEQAWGLEVWRETPRVQDVRPHRDSAPLPAAVLAESLRLHDAFYACMRRLLDQVAARCGRFVVLDLHSYNHRRGGPRAAPDDPLANPDLNVGTAGLERSAWAPVLDAFVERMRAQTVGARPLDVRENVRFGGGYFPRWVNATYGPTGCALALEWKKTFMDEWTGTVDSAAVAEIGKALSNGVEELRAALERCSRA